MIDMDFLAATILVIIAVLVMALILIFSGPSYETGSLYRVDHYYIEADGQTYKVIVDRSGGHHVMD